MPIASLTLAWFRVEAPAPVPRGASTGEAPTAAPAPQHGSAAPCDCPAPRAGLADAVQSAAGTGDVQAKPELRDAVVDFARALMQALRSEGESGRGQGHHRHDDDDHPRDDDHEHRGRGRGHAHGWHHGHGHDEQAYRSQQSLAERIDALARRFEGAAPVPAPAPALPGPPAPVAAPVAEAAPMPEPVTDGTPAQGMILVARIEIEPRNSPFAHFQQQLLESFARLREAMGEAAPADGMALRDDLAAFLYRLAGGLDGDAAATDDDGSTVPGALIDLAA